MRYVRQFTSLIDRIIDVYERNASTKLCECASVLQRMSLISEMTLSRGTIAYVVVASAHFINPIYSYFWQHECKPLMPLYVPFVDERTAFGFVILMSIQSVQVIAALLASGCVDFALVIFALNIWVFSTIFQQTVIELNGILHEKQTDMPWAVTKLQSDFEMYNDNWM